MARPPTESTRVNLYVPDKLWDVVKKMAKRRGLTYSELVRQAILEYLKRELEDEKKVGI